uniref:Variant surface glycoprotein 1125.5592 n=1 Tax=Trypanosoma brucei TaxID=5691 RepID=A0A1J0RCQ1_9TRYP|nr:variant surface glycoprotein 1125.5592 [Trypanosoma brucei]
MYMCSGQHGKHDPNMWLRHPGIKKRPLVSYNRQRPKCVWDVIRPACEKIQNSKLTEATIHQALAAFDGILKNDEPLDGSNKAMAYLGHHNTGDCGSANIERCVDHSTVLNLKGDGNNKLHWYEQMAAAAESTKAWSDARRSAETINQRLEINAQIAEQLYAAALIPEKPVVKQPLAQQSPTQTKCKLKNTAAEECTSDHCDCDSEKKECKAKPGTETPAAGTGETPKEGEGTEKCKGKKRGLQISKLQMERKECKNSIISLNEKNFLIVAAFTGFVGF